MSEKEKEKIELKKKITKEKNFFSLIFILTLLCPELSEVLKILKSYCYRILDYMLKVSE